VNPSNGSADGIGNVVAKHYDNLPERGREQRSESRIFHMRNFNNWIKSSLINEYMDKLKSVPSDTGKAKLKVLDIGCGKGGDLLKWQRSGAAHVVGVDIAATSIEQCKDRYHEMRGRNRDRIFDAEFYAVDCTKQRTRELYRDKDIQFDLVSCQFAFHYSFESLQQAECMMRNIAENLKVGGFFIGTTPDSHDIMARLEASETNSFGNSVFSVTFPSDRLGQQPALFGAQYTFHLKEVVDCPEFLVHFPTLVKLAERFGLTMIAKQRFQNYFHERKEKPEHSKLLGRMNALESYPARRREAGGPDQYDTARHFIRERPGVQGGVGTLSKDEWEALTIYTVFAFKKMA